MTPPTANFSAATCSIGIVTYLGRFETCFQPLIKRLSFLFPDYEINVFINGHYNIGKQVEYLREVTAFLQRFAQVRYVTQVDHQPLARAWNWLLLMSTRPWVLILNDDVFFNFESRHNLEKLRLTHDIFLLNNSFSHFLISHRMIRTLGWFDERFLGLGCEDHDYSFRLAMRGIKLPNRRIPGLDNLSAYPADPGWLKVSDTEKILGRYSQENRNILQKKWYWSEFGEVPEKGAVRFFDPSLGIECTIAPRPGIEAMPRYYPYDCLAPPTAFRSRIYIRLLSCFSRAISYLSYICRELRRTLKLRERWRKLLTKHRRAGNPARTT